MKGQWIRVAGGRIDGIDVLMDTMDGVMDGLYRVDGIGWVGFIWGALFLFS